MEGRLNYDRNNFSLHTSYNDSCYFMYSCSKKVPVYEEFIEGAKDGFKVAVSIIPYLVAIIVAVSMFKASGILDFAKNFAGSLIPADIIPIIATRSLSGSATLGLFSDIVKDFGPDSYIAKLAAIMVGSSETTFYVLAVYFGSVGIKNIVMRL